MKWLRMASKKDSAIDGHPVAPASLTVEAKGERAKIRSLRLRLEDEDEASEIKALSDAIDALESRMEKDQARREKRKQDKAEKAKDKPAVEVEAAGRRAPAPSFAGHEAPDPRRQVLDPLLDEVVLDDPIIPAESVGEGSAADVPDFEGDIVTVEIPDEEDGVLSVDVDAATGKPLAAEYRDTETGEVSPMDAEGLALLADDKELMDGIAKFLAESVEDVIPSAVEHEMEAVTKLLGMGAHVGSADSMLVLQAKLEVLGTEFPRSAGIIGRLYNALELGYRELMEDYTPRVAASDDKNEDKENAMSPEKKTEEKKEEAPKADSKAPEKKDDAKKDAPAAPKKDAPKSPKADDGDKHEKDCGKDCEKAEEAIEILRDLISREKAEGEGGAHAGELEMALNKLEDFLVEEEDEDDDDDAMFMAPKAPGAASPKLPGLKPAAPELPGKMPGAPIKMNILPPAGGPAPKLPGMASRKNASLAVGTRVWRKANVGSMEHVGDEAGRVVASEGANVVVDWGDEELAEVAVSELVTVEAADGEADMFTAPAEAPMTDEAADDVRTASEEAAAILGSVSFKDMLARSLNRAEHVEGDVVHLASGKIGSLVSESSDGRVVIDIEGKRVSVWPHEIAPADTDGAGGLFK